MKLITKLIIGLIIFIIILYLGIVAYLVWLDQKNNPVQNNCNFNFSYNVTKAIDNLDENYNDSIDKLNDFLENGK